jgi:hypothetical protein
MNGILIFIAGAFFGALVVCFSVCTAIFASVLIKEKRTAAAEKRSASSTQEEEVGDVEGMKIQLANFLNYNGTPEGQVDLGGE